MTISRLSTSQEKNLKNDHISRYRLHDWPMAQHRSYAVKRKIKKIVDVDTLLNRLEQIRAYEETTRTRFKDKAVLEITYEDLAKNPVDEFKRIGAFLDVTDIDPK